MNTEEIEKNRDGETKEKKHLVGTSLSKLRILKLLSKPVDRRI